MPSFQQKNLHTFDANFVGHYLHIFPANYNKLKKQNQSTFSLLECLQLLSRYIWNKLSSLWAVPVPVIFDHLSHALTNHPWKGDSAGAEGWMDNHGTRRIIKWLGKYAPLQHYCRFKKAWTELSNSFINQIFLSIKCFQCGNCFQHR